MSARHGRGRLPDRRPGCPDSCLRRCDDDRLPGPVALGPASARVRADGPPAPHTGQASYKKSRKWFKQPSLNADGTIYADEAWHNVTNIQIACDLNDDSPLEWGSEVMAEAELDNLNKDLGEDPVFQGHLKHMESVANISRKNEK